MAPCNNGTQEKDPLDCKDATKQPVAPLNELGGTARLAPGQVPLEDKPCLYDTSLPQCAPDANGNCRDGYGMNDDGRCFVIHNTCPDGYHSHEDDESGECIPDSIKCDPGYEKTSNGKNCERSDNYLCERNPLLKECYDNGNGNSDNDKTKVVHKTTVIQSASASASATTNAADVSSCKLDGSADGISQKFDPVKYQACGLYTNGDKAYYDGFLTGCGHMGNTKLICEAVADSTILNMKTQPIQTPTQTAPQPTRAIQPAAVSG